MSTFRPLLKTAVASVLHRLKLDRAWSSVRERRNPFIVGYHRVVQDFDEAADGSLPAMLISVRTLERHLDWMARRFQLVSIDELARDLEAGRSHATPRAAVTFDDAYRDVYENARPMLKRKGIPAAIFVPTAFVGTDRLHAHDRLFLILSRAFEGWSPRFRAAGLAAALVRAGESPDRAARLTCGSLSAVSCTPLLLESLSLARVSLLMDVLEEEVGLDLQRIDALRSMDWSMVSRMAQEGFTIGCHTWRHALLTNEDRETRALEATGGRIELEARLGTPIRHFAYPAGCFDGESVRTVADAGYHYGYTTCRHRDPARPLLTIPRRVFWEHTSLDFWNRFSPALMSCQVNGIFGRDRCRHSPDLAVAA